MAPRAADFIEASILQECNQRPDIWKHRFPGDIGRREPLDPQKPFHVWYQGFAAEVWPLVGRKVSVSALINDISETACSSIALPLSSAAAAIAMFRLIIAQARSLIQQRNRIEETAHATLAQNRDHQLLIKIPGSAPSTP